MRIHREEGRFTVRVELSAEFDESYEGDDDGYAWLRAWQADVRPRLTRAVIDVLRAGNRFDAIPVSRGGAPDENFEVAVSLRIDRTQERTP